MLNLNLHDLLVEFKDGSIQNVGPTNKHAAAKLFDVADVELREFGDRRVKLVASDDSGNEVQIALFPEHVDTLLDDLEGLQDDSPVFK
ncbi:MAG: hypothetical protein ABEJ57_04640 [Halobacteriaceae archaeon]